MDNRIDYKGYVGEFRYQPGDDRFHGMVLGLREILHFSGTSLSELKQSMARSVDDYLARCAKGGVAPEKPYTGRFIVRIPPDLHRTITGLARASGMSLNQWVAEALAREATLGSSPPEGGHHWRKSMESRTAVEDSLIQAFIEIREDDVAAHTRELLDSGVEPLRILDLVREASVVIGEKFERKEYFLPELIMAGEMMGSVAALVKPHLTGDGRGERAGKVLIGTVKGDVHDIGKQIVGFLFDANGYEVRDLGIDVSPEGFVNAVREYKPDILGLSGLLTVSFYSMKETVDAINAAGLRDSLKVMIGGSLVDDKVVQYVGADGFGRDPAVGVALARQWMGR